MYVDIRFVSKHYIPSLYRNFVPHIYHEWADTMYHILMHRIFTIECFHVCICVYECCTCCADELCVTLNQYIICQSSAKEFLFLPKIKSPKLDSNSHMKRFFKTRFIYFFILPCYRCIFKGEFLYAHEKVIELCFDQ